MKKTISLLLVLAVFFGLTSCADFSPVGTVLPADSASGEQTAAEQPEAEPVEKEPYTWNLESFLASVPEDEIWEKVCGTVPSVFESLSKKPTFSSAFPQMKDYPEEYAMLESLGTSSVPYILKYLFREETDGFNNAFLMMACQRMIKDANPGTDPMQSKIACEFHFGSPKYYAVQMVCALNE